MRDSSGRHDLEPLRPDATELRRKDSALRSGLRKRAAGVPTYSVPEAAALLSVSREHLYRLIRVGAFPALRMGLGAEHGRYVVSARTVEDLLDTVPTTTFREPDVSSGAAAGGAR
jgi:excisionase family DNA binding protein